MESRLDSVQITMTKAELADFARSVAEEVLARLDAAERLHSNDPVIATGTLIVNLPGHEAVVDSAPVKLKTREFALLAALAQNLGRVLTREQLLELAWPEPEGVEENRTVDVHIRRVRVALGPAASLIETVHGIGYKLVKAPHPPAIEV
jgi:two-component system phosphate regulon response regulator PhoB